MTTIYVAFPSPTSPVAVTTRPEHGDWQAYTPMGAAWCRAEDLEAVKVERDALAQKLAEAEAERDAAVYERNQVIGRTVLTPPDTAPVAWMISEPRRGDRWLTFFNPGGAPNVEPLYAAPPVAEQRAADAGSLRDELDAWEAKWIP